MPLYPGTGALNETGVGNIWNAPLRPGDGGDRFKEAFESRILPALRNFSPDIVLISAGFDAHQDDPLANLQLTEPDFALGHDQDRGSRRTSMRRGGWYRCSKEATTSPHWRNRSACTSRC